VSTYIERLATDIRSRVPTHLVPSGNVDALFLLYAALALAKGEKVDRRDVHNAWAAWMASTQPSHESIRPYDDLPAATRREDDPFVSAIRASVREWSGDLAPRT
jgi:hypothetical protein